LSIATLEDMKVLYSGFDLCDPTTSVSMTINGPAPTILAMFLNCAIDQQIDKFQRAMPASPTPERRGNQGRTAFDRSRHGAGGHLKEDQGAEHLHLLDRVSSK